MKEKERNKHIFEQAYTDHYVRLYYYALHFIDDEDVCKDLLNDVFTALWNRMDSINPDTLYAYLSTSLRNSVYDYLRHNKQKALYTEEYLHVAELYYTHYSADDDKLVEQMFAQLSPPTDQILDMCYMQHMKYAEVAEALHISPSTVKKHISKALKTLRELYKDKKDARFV